MFSGLGSISDLNQQFAQFTSNLTNLDSLQDGTAVPNSSATPDHSEINSDSFSLLEQANNKLTEELEVQKALVGELKAYLLVKDEQLHTGEFEVTDLTNQVKRAVELERDTRESFSHYKIEAEERIKILGEKLTLQKDRIQKSIQPTECKPNIVHDDCFEQRKSSDIEDELRDMLNESRQACRSADKQLEDLSCCLTKVQSDLTSSEKELQLKNCESRDAILLVEELRAQLCIATDRLTACEEETEAHQKALTNVIERLESDVQGYLNNIVELKDEQAKYLERCSVAEARNAELEEQLVVQKCSEQNSALANNSSVDALAQQIELAETRARLLQEADGKVGTLTEKLKDMMHRFADLKSKSSLQAQQLEERITEITKLAQGKDSEILGLRLKIENSERSGSDLRLKVGELAERYGETQRELTRLREAAEERQLDVTTLMEERDGLAEALVVCEGARDELLSRLKSTEEQLPVQLAAHDTRIAELQSQLSRRGEEFSEQLAQLRAEVDAAHSRLRVEEDSAGNLDNYKKRAQIALKKANTSNASLTSEIQQLQRALDESEARFAEAQITNNVVSVELAATTNMLASSRTERDSLERTVSDLRAKHIEFEQQSAKLTELLAQCERDPFDPNIWEPKASTSVPTISEGAASVLVPLRVATDRTGAEGGEADPQAAEEASSSADSDFVQFGANTYDSTVRGSSWAMVAASGSRTTSTHPSTASIADDVARGTIAAVRDPTVDDTDDRNDFRTALSSDSLLFISQLQSQLESVRKELSRRGIDLEAAHQQLQYEKDEKRALKNRVEELLAFLERTKQLHEGPDSAINMEYLKNCMYKFMCSSDLSEQRRLYPVIATILKLTSQEMKAIELAFQRTEERENEFQNTLTSIGSFASSSLGSFWGSATGTS